MIRAFSLLCKLNSLKLSDKQLFLTCLDTINIHNQTCPYCKSTGPHDSFTCYQRGLITFASGERKDLVVSVPRVKCTCGHTHAVLPDILIPYGSYSLRFVLTVLSRYLIRSCTVTQLCDKFQISTSTLYNWIHLFIEHYNLLIGAIDSLNSLTLESISYINELTAVASSFYQTFRHSFLQPHHYTTDSHPG